MKIHVSTGLGTGPTKLAAFDAALNAVGIQNYNLIKLSSVIPPDSEIIQHRRKIVKKPGLWGDRLYIVMADIRVDTPNREAWAGIGWVQDKKSGKGLFVEHIGSSETTVKQDINDSLKALMEYRNVRFGRIEMKIQGGVCHGQPLCVLAVAAYQVSDWTNSAIEY